MFELGITKCHNWVTNYNIPQDDNLLLGSKANGGLEFQCSPDGEPVHASICGMTLSPERRLTPTGNGYHSFRINDTSCLANGGDMWEVVSLFSFLKTIALPIY